MSAPTSSSQQFVDDSSMLGVRHIPAIARMCRRLGLIYLSNRSIPCNSDLDTTKYSFDTTSVNVWGDYEISRLEKP